MPSRQHLRCVKQNKVAPPRQEVTQSHAEDLRDLLHGMHPGWLENADCLRLLCQLPLKTF